MVRYLNQVINPDKPWLFMDDTKENIINDLKQYTLDPVFENYGNFVYEPHYDNDELNEQYKGCKMISGNFIEFSHAFRLITDDAAVIAELSDAIRENQDSDSYKKAKEHYIRLCKIECDLEERKAKLRKRGKLV